MCLQNLQCRRLVVKARYVKWMRTHLGKSGADKISEIRYEYQKTRREFPSGHILSKGIKKGNKIYPLNIKKT